MERRQKLLVPALALVSALTLGLLLKFVLGDTRQGPRGMPQASTPPQDNAVPLAPNAEPRALEPTRDALQQAAAASQVQRASLGGDVVPQEGAIWLSGSIVIREPDGSEELLASGRFTLVLSNYDRAKGQAEESRMRLAVEQGRWGVQLVPYGDEYMVPELCEEPFVFHPKYTKASAEAAALGEGQVEFEEESANQSFIEGSVTFRARHHWPTLLCVRDALSGATLDNITLIETNDWVARNSAAPKASERPQSENIGLRSPVPIPSGVGTKLYLVWSPGYAWAQVLLNPRGEGTRLVDLEPGGDLEVLLGGEYRQAGLRLRLRGLQDRAREHRRSQSSGSNAEMH